MNYNAYNIYKNINKLYIICNSIKGSRIDWVHKTNVINSLETAFLLYVKCK